MTCDAVVIEEEVTDVVVAEATEVTILEDGSDSVLVLEPSTDVAVLEDETADVVVVEAQSTEVVVVESGAAAPATTYLTEFLVDGLYVGTAPKGATESDQAWSLVKIVEADDHPKKVPSAPGLHLWTDRASLTYVAG